MVFRCLVNSWSVAHFFTAAGAVVVVVVAVVAAGGSVAGGSGGGGVLMMMPLPLSEIPLLFVLVVACGYGCACWFCAAIVAICWSWFWVSAMVFRGCLRFVR